MTSAPKARPRPGVAAIGLWLFFLCLLGLLRIGNHTLSRWAVLFCIFFAVAGQGLIRQKRWGWAMSLAAVISASLYSTWAFDRFRHPVAIAMAIGNFLLFLYLMRPAVRARMS
jgi:uncharacterized membrane protein (DUF2068 family)